MGSPLLARPVRASAAAAAAAALAGAGCDNLCRMRVRTAGGVRGRDAPRDDGVKALGAVGVEPGDYVDVAVL